jgi:hypothetical protein
MDENMHFVDCCGDFLLQLLLFDFDGIDRDLSNLQNAVLQLLEQLHEFLIKLINTLCEI